MNDTEYAVAILVDSPQGILLVRDPSKPTPVYWKLPGGRSRKGESAKEAASRELNEETGISVPAEDFQLLHQEARNDHSFMLFSATLTSLSQLKTKGEDNEDVALFSRQQIVDMDGFFPPHRKVLSSLHLLSFK